MRVGIDLDGVCYDFTESFRQYLTVYRGYDPAPFTEPTRWEFYEDWGFSLEEFVALCDDGVDDGIIFSEGDPFPGTREALERMKADGHTLHIVTDRSFGRPGESEYATRAWLDHHGLPFDSLTFSRDKTVVRLDIMVDDRPKNYDELIAAGVEAWLQDRLHNRKHRAWRVKDLTEFAEFVSRGGAQAAR